MNFNDNNKYNLIDKYLKGGMNQNEIDSFKAFLQSDKDLTDDLNIVAEINEARDFSMFENQLRSTLSDIRTEATNIDSSSSSTRSFLLKSALIFCFIAGSLLLLFKYFNPLTESVKTIDYQQIAMIEPLELTTKSNSNTDYDIRKMQDLYNEGQYAEAIPLLDQYLLINPNDLDVLLAKGIALTEIQNYTAAHKVFAEIKDLNPRVKKFLWFDALAYSKDGKMGMAKTLLQEIVTTKGYNYQEASELLGTIE